MRVIVCTGYGFSDVPQLQEVETPTAKDNKVLAEFCVSIEQGGS